MKRQRESAITVALAIHAINSSIAKFMFISLARLRWSVALDWFARKNECVGGVDRGEQLRFVSGSEAMAIRNSSRLAHKVDDEPVGLSHLLGLKLQCGLHHVGC